MGDHLGIPGAVGFLPTRRGPLAPAPRPNSRTPRSPSPSRGRGIEWPGPRLPLQTWVASVRPASPSAFAFGFQETRPQVVPSPSWAPLASSGNPRGCTGSSPSPSPRPRPTPRLGGHPSRVPTRVHAQIYVPKWGIYLVDLYFGWIYAWEWDC